jgi:hypothetical protein
MDAALTAAARALSVFAPLDALKGIALRSDPPALAMRGIAMAQLGEYAVARKLLRRASNAFASVPLARARCVAAEAEVALICRDLAAARRGFESAAVVLEAHGDVENALFARLQLVTRLVLIGRLEDAARSLEAIDVARAPARLVALKELVTADLAVRRVRPRLARRSLARADAAARQAGLVSLTREVERAQRNLDAPVARLCESGAERAVNLDEVSAVFRSREFVVDACRGRVRVGVVVVSLASRPVLLALVVALGEASPGEASREELVRRAFFAPRVSASMRARLRVEVGRLRALLGATADIRATPRGFALSPRDGSRVLVLLPPTGEANALVALLGGGEAWSTSALAAALGRSQRAVQRALTTLESEGRVQSTGRGRSRRWMAPAPTGFATTLLLAPTRSTS